MDSWRDATQIADLDEASLSIRKVGEKYKLPIPYSLRKVINELDPDQIVFKTGHIEAGDVSGSARLAVLSSGWWSLKGNLHDSGTFYGDNYALVLALNHVDDFGKSAAVSMEGHIDAGEDESFQLNGKDPWIAENWGEIKAEGFRWHIEVKPSIGSGEILPLALKALGIGLTAGLAFIWLSSETEGNCYWETRGDGEVVRRCEP